MSLRELRPLARYGAWALVAGAIAAGWCTPCSRVSETPSTAVPEAPASADTAALERRIAALESELAAIRAEQRTILREVRGRAPDIRKEELVDPVERAAREVRAEEERFAVLDTRVREEGVDRDWRAFAADALDGLIAPLAGSRVDTVSCGSSLCRIELFHEDAAMHEKFLGRLHASPLAAGGTLARGQSEGERAMRTIVYVMKRQDEASTP